MKFIGWFAALVLISIGGRVWVGGSKTAWSQFRTFLIALVGGKAEGRVVGISPDRTGSVGVRVAFTAADGRRVKYRELMAWVNVGDTRSVRYRRRTPKNATSRTPHGLFVGVLGYLCVACAGWFLMLTGLLPPFLGWDSPVIPGITAPGVLVPLGFVLFGLTVGARRAARSRRRRVLATGKVTRLVPPERGKETYPRPWVSYTTPEGHEVEYWDLKLSGYEPGDEVEVSYDPEFPEFTSTATPVGRNFATATAMSLLGVVLIAASVWMVWAVFTAPV